MIATTRHVAVVGPSAPDRGGIVQHTAELVRRLGAREISVELHAWRRQFPRRLAPPASDDTSAASTLDPSVSSRALAWDRPDSWLRLGFTLRREVTDLVLVMSDPRQMPALAMIASTFRARRSGTRRIMHSNTSVRMIVHNVLPHEPSWLARSFAPAALRIADQTIVHSTAQLLAARQFGATDVVEVRLPLHLTSSRPGPSEPVARTTGRICVIGNIRDYKGLDLLIDALGLTASRPRLEVRGAFWRPPYEFLARADRAGVADLIEFHDGFADDAELFACIDRSDVLVLPYRSATGTQQPRLAFSRGVPVIASDVDGLAEQVRNGVDGLIFPAGDTDALARCIDEVYRPEVLGRLRQGIIPPDPDREWTDYLEALFGPHGLGDLWSVKR